MTKSRLQFYLNCFSFLSDILYSQVEKRQQHNDAFNKLQQQQHKPMNRQHHLHRAVKSNREAIQTSSSYEEPIGTWGLLHAAD